MTKAIRAVRYSTTRFTIDTGQDPEHFRARYEQAVPPLPEDEVAELARSQAPWPQMLDLIASRTSVSTGRAINLGAMAALRSRQSAVNLTTSSRS